jgi:hypothetical protein
MATKISIRPVAISATEPVAKDDQEHSSLERGLLKLAGKQKYTIAGLSSENAYLQQNILVPGIKAGIVTDNVVWDYLHEFPIWTTCSSKHYNVKSSVDWYENKKGERFKAHFTKHGNYLRRINPGEEDGVWYDGQFPITPKVYKIVVDQSATTLVQMFQLIN